MYSLFGQSGSLPSSGGVVEDAMVFDEGSGVSSQELHTRHQHHQHHNHHHHHNHQQQHNLQQHYHQNGQPNSEEDSSISDREREVQQAHRQEPIPVQQRGSQEIADFEDFLYCRAGTSRDMVAQDMAQSYDQLFQESEQFITLEELGPLVAHQQDHRSQTHRVSTSNTSAHLYPGNYTQHNSGAHQQRTYYNLSSATQDSSCTSGYFGNTGESSVAGELGTSAVAQEDLPPTVLTPSQTSSSHSSNTKNNNNNVLGLTKCDSNSSNSNDKEKKKELEAANNESQSETLIRTELAPCFNENKPTVLPDQGSTSGHHYNNNNHQDRHHNYHHHHHRLEDSEVEATPSHGTPFAQPDDFPPLRKKQKISSHEDNETPEETGEDVKSARASTDNKKQNHSEIEKRRRDKMNTYITELSTMVPMCHAMSRKLDKLTVLRMAVQHLKTILGSATSFTEGHYKPSFLSDQELKTLILQAAEGFVFVVGCDRGRILYVSESVSKTLNYTQEDLLGQSWFDILHPKDVAKVKEQLSSSDLNPRERLIDAKTMLPLKTDVPQEVTRLCPGARRSFFCRMKRKLEASNAQVKEEAESSSSRHRRKKQQNVDWKYCVIHCTGYLKSWAPAKMGLEETERNADADGEGCNLSCLVAVGRVQPELPELSAPGPSVPRLRPIEFISRHAIDGKFLFVDQRATLVLGFLPQELQGTSMYEYYHHDDIPHLADCHKAALRSPERVTTRIYRFRTKGSSFVNLQSEWKSFRNPWTKDIDYLISKNSTIYCDTRRESQVIPADDCNVQESYNYFAQSNGELERMISSHVEMSKIGRKIAEEVLDHNQKRIDESGSISSPNPPPDRTTALNTEFQIATVSSPSERVRNSVEVAEVSETNCSVPTTMYSQIRSNVQLSGIVTDVTGGQSDEDMMEMIGSTALSESTIPLPSDGNDEAAMAVIMSLLEADAGLGGPVDFSGLPWPLP